MTWLMTASGRKVDLLKPDPCAICIEDIAHSLSLQCRFNGHCRLFYSVAQHSVHCSEICDPKYALECLMHDAAEAYVGDIVRPLKGALSDSALGEIEFEFECVIAEALGMAVVPGFREEVRRVDNIMLATERRDLLPPSDEDWPSLRGVVPMEPTIHIMAPVIAERAFLARYAQLRGDA